MSDNRSKEEILAAFELERERLANERKANVKKYWSDEIKPFKEPEDVPNLPTTQTAEEWSSFYVPKIIAAGGIPKKDLKDGHYYLGEHRNARIARWDEAKNRFFYWRTKFTWCFEDECEHFEEFSPFALFVPIREVSQEEYEATNTNKK
jgi:hypothetical protein